MSCDICGPKNPNNPRWGVTHACLDALVARVAKLEAASSACYAMAYAMSRSPSSDQTQTVTDTCKENPPTVERPALGQLASGGEATVPPAEPVSPALCGDVGPRDVFCSRYEGHELPHRGWKSDKGSEWWPRGVTPPNASWESATESVSAPAEQPSRQETGGGETGDAIDWSRFVPSEKIPEDNGVVHRTLTEGDVFAAWADSGRDCGSVRMFESSHIARCLAGGHYWHYRQVRLIRHADGHWADGFNPSGPCRERCGYSGPEGDCQLGRRGTKPCWRDRSNGEIRHFCTEFCRDRAKAKAAEQASACCRLCGGDVIDIAEHRCPPPCEQCGRPTGGCCTVVGPPAEPSGTGQLPSAPVGFRVVGRSGTGNREQPPDAWLRFARKPDGSESKDPPRQRSTRQILRKGWNAGCYDILEPIAEPPVPAVGTWTEDDVTKAREVADSFRDVIQDAPAVGTLSERIRERCRFYTDDIRAGWTALSDEVAALEAQLALNAADAALVCNQRAALLRRVDELHAKLAHAEDRQRELLEAVSVVTSERDHARTQLAQAERERDDWAQGRKDAVARLDKVREERDTARRALDETKATIERVAYNTPEAVARSESEVTVLVELRRTREERDDATARERESCLRVVNVWLSCDGLNDDDLREAISKPAPETDKPSKCEADPPREKQDPGGLTPILGRLDPGIRATVCQIRAWGFVTTDSGDGVSKFKKGTATDDDGCTLKIPHVFCSVDKYCMVQDSRRLLELLRDAGVHQANVEVTFSPNDEEAVMGIYEVTDYVWPVDKRPPGFDQLLAASQRKDKP